MCEARREIAGEPDAWKLASSVAGLGGVKLARLHHATFGGNDVSHSKAKEMSFSARLTKARITR